MIPVEGRGLHRSARQLVSSAFRANQEERGEPSLPTCQITSSASTQDHGSQKVTDRHPVSSRWATEVTSGHEGETGKQRRHLARG